jgi:Protein of unknown function (DUF2585)
MLNGPVPPLLIVAASVLLTVFRQRFVHRPARRGVAGDVIVITVLICLALFLELQMGRHPTYQHGPVRLWSGNVQSDQNSQQVFDPYTPTHVIHGAVFFGLTRLVLGAAPVGLCAIVAMTLEAAWEVYENTDQVIDRYRAGTISLGYYGDSVINSLADMLACAAGFLLARWLPGRVTVAWIVAVELILAFWIRDNLTLNLIMLIHPVDAIRVWQMGA